LGGSKIEKELRRERKHRIQNEQDLKSEAVHFVKYPGQPDFDGINGQGGEEIPEKGEQNKISEKGRPSSVGGRCKPTKTRACLRE